MILKVPHTHAYFVNFINEHASERFQEYLNNEKHGILSVFVYIDNFEVVGATTTMRYYQNNNNKNVEKGIWFIDLLLKPTEREKGIEKKLIEAIIFEANDIGDSIYFHCDDEVFYQNWKTQPIYESSYNILIPCENILTHNPEILTITDYFLHVCEQGHLDEIKKLLSCSELDRNSVKVSASASIAVQQGNLDMLRLLISQGINIYQRGIFTRFSVLTMAVCLGSLNIVRYLLTSNELENIWIYMRSHIGIPRCSCTLVSMNIVRLLIIS